MDWKVRRPTAGGSELQRVPLGPRSGRGSGSERATFGLSPSGIPCAAPTSTPRIGSDSKARPTSLTHRSPSEFDAMWRSRWRSLSVKRSNISPSSGPHGETPRAHLRDPRKPRPTPEATRAPAGRFRAPERPRAQSYVRGPIPPPGLTEKSEGQATRPGWPSGVVKGRPRATQASLPPSMT
jgi:hypothetical protein